ncbi:DUF2303 family protein, partial [Escherichia coli]|uniref:DUF2303 family protein n=1 Tax=Escherichia coli TaxID=562 RepID=UPI003F663C23
PLTDFGGKTSIFSHPVYLFLREFSLQDFRGGSLAEWIEDWADYLVGFDANGDAIQATKAAAAVRKITIEANQTADFEDNDFSGKRSLMESVEAKT